MDSLIDTVCRTLRRYRWLVLCLWVLVAWVVGPTNFPHWLLRHKVAGVLFILTAYLAWKDER